MPIREPLEQFCTECEVRGSDSCAAEESDILGCILFDQHRLSLPAVIQTSVLTGYLAAAVYTIKQPNGGNRNVGQIK